MSLNRNAENEQVVRQLFDGVDTRGAAVLYEVCSSDLAVHLFGSTLGRDEFSDLVKGFLQALPDVKHNIEDLISVNDRVVARLSFIGTHQGELQGYAPTGKQVKVTEIAIYRILDGKISEIWEEFDLLGLWQQLGVELPIGS